MTHVHLLAAFSPFFSLSKGVVLELVLFSLRHDLMYPRLVLNFLCSQDGLETNLLASTSQVMICHPIPPVSAGDYTEYTVFNLEIHYNGKYTSYYVCIMFSFVFNEVSYSHVFNSLIHGGDS